MRNEIKLTEYYAVHNILKKSQFEWWYANMYISKQQAYSLEFDPFSHMQFYWGMMWMLLNDDNSQHSLTKQGADCWVALQQQ